MSVQFNPTISGVSVSGDLDTLSDTLTIEMGNSDTIGHATITLQNSQAQYSKLLTSGNAAMAIATVTNGISAPLFAGTCEKVVPEVDLKSNKGSIVTIDAYDHAQELMNVLSPDARPPYLVWTPNSGAQSGITMFSVTSGDGGLQSQDGMDLVLYTSGTGSTFSGLVSVTVAQFMSQWYGISGDHTGSASGNMFSFKPYVPGYTWTTYYTPDSSGNVAANDNNNNYYLYQDKLKAKREFAWDTLRKITRQQVAVDGNGNPAAFEAYVDTVGAIHLYASGSYQLVASGVSLIYYPAGVSGSQNNNILNAQVPFDLTQVKNVVEGWFQDWTVYPYDSNLWTGFVAYSGGLWSAKSGPNGPSPVTFTAVVLSGGPPSSTTGSMAIQATGYSGTAAADCVFPLVYTLPNGTFVNLNQWNVVLSGAGIGANVNLNFSMFQSNSDPDSGTVQKVFVHLVDISGNYISTGNNAINTTTQSGWQTFSLVVFVSGGPLNSGLWSYGANFAASSGVPNLNYISQIVFVNRWDFQTVTNNNGTVAYDSIQFSFDYPFSPITAFNSGSQGMYGRRYQDIEWPYEVSAGAASGIMYAQLNATLGPQGIAQFLVKDNPNLPFSAQQGIAVGQVFALDSPYFNAGSGQYFNYFRATAVTHNWDKTQNGFETTIKAVPWYSGTLAIAQTNAVTAQTPIMYSSIMPAPTPEQYMPIARFYNNGTGK
jgi:hypothetical protein